MTSLTQLNTRLPEPLIERLRQENERQRRPLNLIIGAGLEHFLALPEQQRDALTTAPAPLNIATLKLGRGRKAGAR